MFQSPSIHGLLRIWCKTLVQHGSFEEVFYKPLKSCAYHNETRAAGTQLSVAYPTAELRPDLASRSVEKAGVRIAHALYKLRRKIRGEMTGLPLGIDVRHRSRQSLAVDAAAMKAACLKAIPAHRSCHRDGRFQLLSVAMMARPFTQEPPPEARSSLSETDARWRPARAGRHHRRQGNSRQEFQARPTVSLSPL